MSYEITGQTDVKTEDMGSIGPEAPQTAPETTPEPSLNVDAQNEQKPEQPGEAADEESASS